MLCVRLMLTVTCVAGLGLAQEAAAGTSGTLSNARPEAALYLVRPPLLTPLIPEPREVEWKNIVQRSTRFLMLQHSFRFLTEPGTRAELRGPFLRDYGRSIRGLRGWGDQDPFLVNYIGHPMMGAVTGFIYVQGDPTARKQELHSPLYWKSRLRAMAFSAAFSTQFELGPLSEAALGNVGRDRRTMGFVDLVVTPLAGTGWMVAEDALDLYLIQPLERLSKNSRYRLVIRSVLNPTRVVANAMRGKVPWHRDTRPGVDTP